MRVYYAENGQCSQHYFSLCCDDGSGSEPDKPLYYTYAKRGLL